MIYALFHIAFNQRIGELREHFGEYAFAEACRDLFFVQTRFVQRDGVQRARLRVPRLRQECGA